MRLEQLVTECGITVFANSAQKLAHRQHHGREAHLAHTETGHCAQQFDELARGQMTALDLLLDKRESGVTGYYGSVEIEECADLRPVRQLHYFGDDVLSQSGTLTPVQWKGFNQNLSQYHGEVLHKSDIQRAFQEKVRRCRANPEAMESADWAGLRLIWEHIIQAFD